MWSATRHEKILAILKSDKQLSTDALADEFKVSRETIRRDLVLLESLGSIDRIHGGAVLSKATNEQPFLQRINIHQKEKRAIAKFAASIIKPNQSIFVDAGTTTSVFATELRKLSGIMVITNSMDIANSFYSAKSKAKLVLLGGEMISDVPGTYGELTLSEISRFNVDLAFLAPVSMSATAGVTYFELHEAEIARSMIKQAQKTVILADHSKLGEASRVQCCDCDQIDMLISGTSANQSLLDGFKDAGLNEIKLAK